MTFVDERVPARVVAAFDFDGTLTAYDSLIPFLVRLRGGPAVFVALGAALPRSVAGRNDAKQAVLARLLRGLDAEAVAAEGRAYAEHLLARRVRPRMRGLVEWHREQGHSLVLVSASLEVYLSEVGRRLGFDAVLASRLEVGPDGRLTGRLDGRNVRGEAKVLALRTWLGQDAVCLHAYGDSGGDREMLATADWGVRVRRGRVLSDRRMP